MRSVRGVHQRRLRALQAGGVAGGGGAAEMEALQVGAAEFRQQRTLLVGLDALGGNGEAEAAAERARYLAFLAGRQERVWSEVESLIATKQSGKYTRAIELLRDLRDLAKQLKTESDFATRLNSLRDRHAQKSAFQTRLLDARLIGR